MLKFSKSFLLIILLIIILSSAFIYYYLFSTTTNNIFPSSKNISKIYIGDIILENGIVKRYSIYFDSTDEINKITNIFSSYKYKRILSFNKNIRNHAKSIRILVFYSNNKSKFNNFDLDINDKGFIICDGKKFKIKNSTDILFNNLYKYFNSNWKPVE